MVAAFQLAEPKELLLSERDQDYYPAVDIGSRRAYYSSNRTKVVVVVDWEPDQEDRKVDTVPTAAAAGLVRQGRKEHWDWVQLLHPLHYRLVGSYRSVQEWIVVVAYQPGQDQEFPVE